MEKQVTKTSSWPRLFFFKKIICSRSKWSAALLQYKYILNLAYNENKLYETLHYWSRCMLNFWFSDKSVGTVLNAWWLLTAFFHLSNMKSKQYCVWNSLQKPHWNVERILSKNVESCFLNNFSKVCDITRKMLFLDFFLKKELY